MKEARTLIRKLQQTDIQLAELIIEHDRLSDDNGLILIHKNKLIKKINQKILDIKVLSSELNKILNSKITPVKNIPLQIGEAIEVIVNKMTENTLTFNYTVGAGDTNSDLDYVNIFSLVLNAGTI